MSDKASTVHDTQDERRRQGGSQEVVLRDESDEIIDHLKNQLRSLQAQLARYKAEDAPTGPARGLDAGLTPHIASRLEIPAGELNARLERLIEQVSDPALQGELEHCRETAFFLFDTFRHIGARHEELTAALTGDTLVMEAGEFCNRLESSLHEHNLAVQVVPEAPLPHRLALSPQSVITVLTTLANLAGALFGRPERVSVSCPDWDTTADGDAGRLRLLIASDRAWRDPERDEAVSSAAIRSGVRSHAVVDLLYVEKIIEMRGGSLGFHRRDGRVHGFEVTVPVTLLAKQPPEETPEP